MTEWRGGATRNRAFVLQSHTLQSGGVCRPGASHTASRNSQTEGHGSGQQLLNQFAVYIRESIISSLESIGQLLVIDPQQVKHGRMEVMHVHRVRQHVVAEVIGRA